MQNIIIYNKHCRTGYDGVYSGINLWKFWMNLLPASLR